MVFRQQIVLNLDKANIIKFMTKNSQHTLTIRYKENIMRFTAALKIHNTYASYSVQEFLMFKHES
jgi:hypothetical protein